MKTKIYSTLVFLLFAINVVAQKPQYDEAKHYQWRSMENGKWKFKPKWYYYKWSLFSNPLGMGFHQSYINKYSQNINHRTPTIAAATVNETLYDKQLTEIEKLRDEEMLKQADRAVNIVDPIYRSKIKNSQNRILENISNYSQVRGEEDIEREILMYNEYYRIMETVNIIKDAYIENAKRQEIYISATKELDELNGMIVGMTKLAYNKKENKHFFNK